MKKANDIRAGYTWEKIRGVKDHELAQWVWDRIDYARSFRLTAIEPEWTKLFNEFMGRLPAGKKWPFPARANLNAIHEVVMAHVQQKLARPPRVKVVPTRKGDTRFGREWAEAQSDMMSYQFDRTKLYLSIYNMLINGTIYGFSPGIVEWYRDTRIAKEPIPTFRFDSKEGRVKVEFQDRLVERVFYEGPRFRSVNNWDFWVDPAATNLFDARYAVMRWWADTDELEARQGTYGIQYKNLDKVADMIGDNDAVFRGCEDVPDGWKDRLSSLGYKGEAVRLGKVPIVEFWTRQYKVVLAGGSILIEKAMNPYAHGLMPFVGYWDILVPDLFYGKGEAGVVRPMAALMNAWWALMYTNAALTIQKYAIAERGTFGDHRQNMVVEPGEIIEVEPSSRPIKDRVQWNEPGQLNPAAYNILEIGQKFLNTNSSLSEMQRGEVSRSYETAYPVQVANNATALKLDTKIRIADHTLFGPVCEMAFVMNNTLATVDLVREVLGDDQADIILKNPIPPQWIGKQVVAKPDALSMKPVDKAEEVAKLSMLLSFKEKFPHWFAGRERELAQLAMAAIEMPDDLLADNLDQVGNQMGATLGLMQEAELGQAAALNDQFGGSMSMPSPQEVVNPIPTVQ